jgi:SAM-dependent methyltransferase
MKLRPSRDAGPAEERGLDKPKPYAPIIAFCEGCLEKHGDSYLGVGWTISQEATDGRYQVMLDMVDAGAQEPVTLLDFGCGASHLREYIERRGLGERIHYSGLDLSPKFLELSRRKFPEVSYYDVDLLDGRDGLPTFDYVVMNGVFTYKSDIPYPNMLDYFKALVEGAFQLTRRALAFNVQSPDVEHRDYLFHVPFDEMAAFLVERISPRFRLRHDYGLYDYTVYVYR